MKLLMAHYEACNMHSVIHWKMALE